MDTVAYAALLAAACVDGEEAGDYGAYLDSIREKHSLICNPPLDMTASELAHEHLALAVAALAALGTCPTVESLRRLPNLEELNPQ